MNVYSSFASRLRTRGAGLALIVVVAVAGVAAIGATASVKKGPTAVLVAIQPVNDKGVMQDFVRGFNEGAKKYGYSQAKVVIVTQAAQYISTLQQVAGRFDVVVTTFPPMILMLEVSILKAPKIRIELAMALASSL